MLTVNDAARAIFGAYRLALLDGRGMTFFDCSREGAARSFYAAVLLLPAFALAEAMRLWPHLPQLPIGRVLAVETISYVVAWTAFPVLMIGIAKALGRQGRYFTFLVAYNWSSVITVAVYLPLLCFGQTGIWPEPLVALLATVVMVAMLVYQWFIARTTLAVSGFAATPIVFTDFLLGWLLDDISRWLIYAG